MNRDKMEEVIYDCLREADLECSNDIAEVDDDLSEQLEKQRKDLAIKIAGQLLDLAN